MPTDDGPMKMTFDVPDEIRSAFLETIGEEIDARSGSESPSRLQRAATFAAMEVNTNPNDYITVSATFDPDALRQRFAAALGRWLAADDGCNIG